MYERSSSILDKMDGRDSIWRYFKFFFTVAIGYKFLKMLALGT